MKKKFTVEFDAEWVLKHRADAVLPVEALSKELKRIFSDKTQMDCTFAEITITDEQNVIDLEKLKKAVYSFLNREYSGENAENSVKILSLDCLEKSEDELCVTREEECESEQTETTVEEKRLLEAVYSSENTQQEQKEGENIAIKKDVFERVDELVGADEFKKLIKEMELLAPQLEKYRTFDIFNSQSYLFSINEGYGFSTYLKLLADAFSQLNIKKMSSNPVVEYKIALNREGMAPYADVLEHVTRKPDSTIQIIGIDISECMGITESRDFKEFLRVLESCTAKVIIVFKIPFVDREVCQRVLRSINDLMFIRCVTFPPFTNNELQKCAQVDLEKYGFKMSKNAWDNFHERLTEEKSDGKFYGLNTVKKVVRELLYKKQLDNAVHKKWDNVISKKDSLSLCQNRMQNDITGYQMLEKLVGCESVKNKINEIVAQIELALKSDNLQSPCIHMRFVGNPGTGKTTVARILGRILKEKGVLRVGNFYEHSGRDFCGRYVGETAPKTSSMCRDAYGSVLFIDEAYSLYRGDDTGRDYGREALDTLIAEMENHRSDFVVIMAGYPDDMDTLMSGNAGLKSRMPYTLEFPNFSREQLYDIYVSMLNGNFSYGQDLLSAAKEYFLSLPEEVLNSKEFSNARFVRNLFERTWAKAAMRCQLERKSKIELIKDDFDRSVSDKDFATAMEKKTKLGF